jgi:uncharacterized protein CbrC (UPF0167 family)
VVAPWGWKENGRRRLVGGFPDRIYQTDTILVLTGGMANHPAEPAATCACCQHRMAAVDREPILFTDGLVDVTYMCDWCGAETKRAVREPGHAGRARNGERRGLVA